MNKNGKWTRGAAVQALAERTCAMWRLGSCAALLVFCVVGNLEAQTAGSVVGWGWTPAGWASLPSGDDFVAVSAGYRHSLALKADGSITAWGVNEIGQLDNLPEGNDFVAVTAGLLHSLALRADGSIVGWGNNGYGQITVPAGNDFVAVDAGETHSLALKSDGTIVSWGENLTRLQDVPPGNDFVAISAGNRWSMALRDDGSIVAWGNACAPVDDAPTDNGFIRIAAGASHGLAVRADGSLHGWGWNSSGQTDVPPGDDFVDVAGGNNYSLALRVDGSIVAWGGNNHDEQDVPTGNDFVAISAGPYHGLAIEVSNISPIAHAGLDQEVQCFGPLTEVSLDGSASSDPDGDALGFEWSVPEGSNATIDDPLNPTPTGQFPIGPTLVTLTVTDGNGGVACDDVLITVIDIVPPVLVATTDKIALWPPNHEMHDVWVSIEITDCAWDTGVALTAWVSSSEPDDATGDGSYVGDVDGRDGFVAPVPADLICTAELEPGIYLYEGLLSLRAERDGGESSRVYSIVCDIEDLAGNTSIASCVVVVPHDRRKK